MHTKDVYLRWVLREWEMENGTAGAGDGDGLSSRAIEGPKVKSPRSQRQHYRHQQNFRSSFFVLYHRN